jgi:hypothetical protein
LVSRIVAVSLSVAQRDRSPKARRQPI